MAIKVGINGFGRIGRLALRASFDWPEIEFVQINDVAGDTATLAHLLEFDSVQGRWHHAVSSEADAILINGKRIRATQEKAIDAVDWSGCDVVIEATGKHRKGELEPVFGTRSKTRRRFSACQRRGDRQYRGGGERPYLQS